jgi:hypothetical protein
MAEQGCHIRVIVITHSAQRCDAGSVIALAVNERIGGLAELLLFFLVLCLVVVVPDG